MACGCEMISQPQAIVLIKSVVNHAGGDRPPPAIVSGLDNVTALSRVKTVNVHRGKRAIAQDYFIQGSVQQTIAASRMK